MTGAIGIKFVGIFIFMIVGLRAAIDLWIVLGDISKPLVFYISIFRYQIHVLISIELYLLICLALKIKRTDTTELHFEAFPGASCLFNRSTSSALLDLFLRSLSDSHPY